MFLVTGRHWTQTDVGLVTTASGLLGIALQTPIGALIDVTRAKRAVIVLTMAAMAAAAAIIFARPTVWPMAIALSILAVAGDAFVPAVSALTLGLVRREQLARRLGRLRFWPARSAMPSHSAPSFSWFRSSPAIRRSITAATSRALTSAAALAIPADAINHDRARDLAANGEGQGTAAGFRVLFETRPLMIFALCAFLFHFANAPLLPLVGQRLALAFPREATAMMSFCMVAAQGVMLPIAIFVGRNADTWGRRPIFLIAFAVLPVRAALYTLSDNAFWLIGVQLLDGVGAGIYQALTPLLIADIMRGTGRYNLAQGAVGTTMGIGASVSALFAGETVDHFGYSVSFLALSAAATVAFLVFVWFMPETREAEAGANGGEGVVLEAATGE